MEMAKDNPSNSRKNSCDMVITNGARMEDLYDIVSGKDVGTRFVAEKNA